jgi:acetylornithine deacetylase/succinyl-diaminopimelate desuccinylase-like protein
MNAHGKNERVEVSELLESVKAYKQITLHCLQH